jgi:cytochrome c553
MTNPMLAFAIALSAVLVGCSDQQASTPGNIAAGKAFAERECKGCHGLDGKGAAPGIPHLAAQRDRYLIISLKEYSEGKRSHAALQNIAKQMSETETRNVATYYASLPPIPVPQDFHAFSPYENGKARAAACASCHGEDGNSKTPGVPSLAGQQPHYLMIAAQEYLTGLRATAPMHALVRDLSKLDLESVALYFAAQTPAQRPAPSFGNAAAGEPLSAACGGCHGFHGISADAITPSLAGQDAQYLMASTRAYRTTRRHPGMQRAVASLSDSDIENIVAFYVAQKSRAAATEQSYVEELSQKCNRCHAADMANGTLTIPIIRGQDKDYLVMALRGYRDDRRESSVMHKMSIIYGDAIIEGIASYYASRPVR